jgi:hypothetical protein
MPDSDESCRIIRPASHTSALGLVFIAENGAGAQGGSCGVWMWDERTWMKAHESNLHGAYRKHTAKARAGRPRQDDKHIGGGQGAAALQDFLIEPQSRF